MEDQQYSPHGRTLVSWEVDEYPHYRRSLLWYTGAAIIGAGLLWYALATVNFLFGLIVLIFAIFLLLGGSREPRRVSVALTEDGLELGRRFYPWRDFERFWLVYEPPMIKTLYLEPRSSVRPPIGVPLEESDPNVVRETLLMSVREDLDEQDEPFSDTIARLLKM